MFRTPVEDEVSMYTQWIDAGKALQENVDAFRLCHGTLLIKVYNQAKV